MQISKEELGQIIANTIMAVDTFHEKLKHLNMEKIEMDLPEFTAIVNDKDDKLKSITTVMRDKYGNTFGPIRLDGLDTED